ncbi:MAG TPA: hypothetical protein PKN96_07270 [Flavobacterium sp.]|uniref:hypothetical protein n=1 Tax=Flavobacterium sp. TaxID=239 RepID=UPI002C558579|nr:hypothetical protein [Flavobacterium sp.]HNP33076.1 hypothetical protein [Flavobacterium sp.]
MKKIFLVASFFYSIIIQAQTTENSSEVIPTLEVQKAFQKEFPKVKPVWRKEFSGSDKDELTYEADFSVNNSNMTAVYNAIGVFKVLQFEIKPTEIPVRISSYMEKNYPKNKIEKAAKMMTNDNKITYEIGITINGKWSDAVFDKEGDFLEMVQKDN